MFGGGNNNNNNQNVGNDSVFGGPNINNQQQQQGGGLFGAPVQNSPFDQTNQHGTSGAGFHSEFDSPRSEFENVRNISKSEMAQALEDLNNEELNRNIRAHSVELPNKNLFSQYDRITSQNISDSDNIALLERYVLGENRQEFFDSLVQNSDTYFYIKFLDQLNRCGVNIPQEIKTEFDDYILSQNTNSKKILLKWIIMQIDDPQTNETKKQEWLSALNEEFFKFKYDFQRPSQIKNLDNFQTNDLETNFEVFPSTLPICYNDVFSSDLYFECLYDNTEAIEKLQAFAPHNK